MTGETHVGAMTGTGAFWCSHFAHGATPFPMRQWGACFPRTANRNRRGALVGAAAPGGPASLGS